MASARPPLLFERVTRQAFSDLKLDEAPVIRDLADLLTRYTGTDALCPTCDISAQRPDTVADALLAIQPLLTE